MRTSLIAFLLPFALMSASIAQVAPAPTAPTARPATRPHPATTATRPNPAAAPVAPASDAGATERGMAPVTPGNAAVTPQVQNANTHDRDAQGHLLDPNGRPVGQKPAAPTAPAPATTAR